MTQRATLVRIPQPCHESWDAMTPTATGRHCAACQKMVVDFTQKTDAEILAALRQASGQTCGRLRADQLARPLVPAAEPSRWRSWLGAMLALSGVLGSSRAAAQTRSYYAGPLPMVVSPGLVPQPAQPAALTSPTSAPLAGEPIQLRGKVLDARTHESLPGVTILLKNTTTGTVTNMAGEFELSLASASETATIVISSIGYVGQEKTLALTAGSLLQVELLMDTQVLGGLIVTDYKRPWPWHPRSLFNWSKYWVTKPFRN